MEPFWVPFDDLLAARARRPADRRRRWSQAVLAYAARRAGLA